MNTIAASTRRVPRTALIGIAVLIAAFAALMVVRADVIGGSSTGSVPIATPSQGTATPARPVQTAPAKPRVVLVAGLPKQVAHGLRYSKVIVVSLYAGSADRASVAVARAGARQAGAGFATVNVLNEKNARSLSSFAGNVSAPILLVVRRPGKIVNRLPGTVDSAIVAQAAHNAGARR